MWMSRKHVAVILVILMVLATLPVSDFNTYAEETVKIERNIAQTAQEILQPEQREEKKLEDNQPGLEKKKVVADNEVNNKAIQVKDAATGLQRNKEQDQPVNKNIVKPHIIIKYKNDIDKVMEKVNTALEQKHQVKDPGKGNRLQVKQQRKSLRMAEISVDSEIGIPEAIEELEKDPEVEFAQPNFQIESMEVPSDPDITKQWALDNGNSDDLYDLNIGDKWTVINSMEPVSVAVIDTGIDINHSELIDKTENGWDFYNDDDSVFDDGDTDHGTMIAGIIGANLDDKGIVGLATKAKIIPLKIFQNGNGYTSDAIAAIEYARSKGAKIVNCSWGSREYNPALKDAIEQNPDMLFICAAGNTGDDSKMFPAAFQLSNVIAVASANQSGEIAASSSYGGHVQIAAPGVDIYSTSPGNKYTYGSGTSLAAGYTTAAAAIYKGIKPEANSEEIASALKEKAVKKESLTDKVTGGLLSITPLLENMDVPVIANPDDDFAYLPQEIIDILNTRNKYSELNDEEKALLNFHLSLKEEVLKTCEEAGLTLKQSIFKAKIMQSINLTVEEAKASGIEFQSEKRAAEQAELLAGYLDRFEALSNDKPLLIELYKKGFPARNLVNAYIVSKAWELEIGDIIAKGDDTTDASSDMSEEQQLIHALAINYNIKEKATISYMQTSKKTVQELEELIKSKKEELNIHFEEELKTLTSNEDAVASIPKAPFGYRAGINETVNLNTGALSYEETLAKMPGKNGLDLNLGLVYNSAESYSGNDQNDKWPQKYLGRGWALNFTRILYKSDGQYVRLTDGSTYPMVNENGTYKLGGYKLDNIKVTANSTMVSALNYADGRKETFDSNGNIISITDRFGNSITFTNKTVGTSNKEVTITDSVGEITRILCNCELAANFYNIILPDKSKIALYLGTSGALIKKEDQVGRVTTYAYESVTGNYNSESRNYLNLTNITYPTGLVSKNEYESANGGIATYYRIKNMNKKDGKHIYLNNTYTYSASYLNTTSDYTTMITNAVGTQSTYTFDYQTHLKKSEMITDSGKLRKNELYEYTNTELPKKITTKLYSTDSNMGKEISKQYTYDNNGNILTYTSPLAEGYANTEYETKYTYDTSYNLLTSKEYKKDANTVIKQINDVTSDRKAIKESRISENDILKKKQSFEYDEFGNIVILKDYTSKDDFIQTSFTYEKGAYIKTKTIGSAINQYSYDSLGRVTGSIDPNGNTTNNEYDALGRTTRTVFPDNKTKIITYNDAENILIITNENGNSFKYKFDGFGNIAQITDQATQSTLASFKYDDLLRNIEKTDGNGNSTLFTYDYADRVLSKTVGGSYQEKYEYEDGYSLGLSREIRTIEGEKDVPTIQIFQDKDVLDKVIKSGFLNGNQEYATTYQYDYLGNKTKELSAKDREQGYEYTKKYETDYSGKMLSETSDQNIVNKYEYDLMGRRTSSTDPEGNITRYIYNEQNKLITEETPLTSNDNTVTNYEYDLKGNMTKKSISSGKPGETPRYRDTRFEYDQRDRLTKVSSTDNGQEYYTLYSYDATGNLTSTATGNGTNITSYTYNSRNKVIKQTDPTGNSESYSYDSNNNMIGKTDKNQNRFVYTYNALNKPLKCTVTQPDGSVQSYEKSYAINGTMIREENENISASLRYDNQGRIVSKEDSNEVRHSYTYDLAGNRIAYQLKQNGQNTIDLTYTYDKQNHLIKVNEGGAERASYRYDLNGNCTETQYDNGIKTSFDYNKANMITNMSNKFNNNTLSNYAYSYYLDGNQSSKTDHLNHMTNYEYDGLARLSKEAVDDSETLYTYDLSSNRIKKSISGANPLETNYAYDANDRLVWEETQKDNNILATTEYYYDANGNQISKLFNDLSDQAGTAASISLETQPNTLYYEQYEYDGFNRLTSYITPTCTAKYTYDAEGLRISKNVNGELTRHIWDGSNMVVEQNDSGQVIDRYIRGTRLIKSDLNGYYLHNAHGDVIQLANQQGTVTKDYLYDAFGNENEAQANDTNPFRYCGEYLDKESGNVYLRARYYDPTSGRFISKDSYEGQINNPLTLNLYMYCFNNPITFVDPTGYQPGDENLPIGTQCLLQAVSKDYNNARATGDTAKMAEAHYVAETARGWAGYCSYNGVTMTPGERDSIISSSSNSGNVNHSSGGYHGGGQPSGGGSPIDPYQPAPTPPISDYYGKCSLPETKPGYWNLNLTLDPGIGITAGLLQDDKGLHPYVGVVQGWGAGCTVTHSFNGTISQGLNISVGASLVVAVSASAGEDEDGYADGAVEVGGGLSVGYGASEYYVF